jgi:hypothetical protein
MIMHPCEICGQAIDDTSDNYFSYGPEGAVHIYCLADEQQLNDFLRRRRRHSENIHQFGVHFMEVELTPEELQEFHRVVSKYMS